MIMVQSPCVPTLWIWHQLGQESLLCLVVDEQLSQGQSAEFLVDKSLHSLYGPKFKVSSMIARRVWRRHGMPRSFTVRRTLSSTAGKRTCSMSGPRRRPYEPLCAATEPVLRGILAPQVEWILGRQCRPNIVPAVAAPCRGATSSRSE